MTHSTSQKPPNSETVFPAGRKHHGIGSKWGIHELSASHGHFHGECDDLDLRATPFWGKQVASKNGLLMIG